MSFEEDEDEDEKEEVARGLKTHLTLCLVMGTIDEGLATAATAAAAANAIVDCFHNTIIKAETEIGYQISIIDFAIKGFVQLTLQIDANPLFPSLQLLPRGTCFLISP